MKSLWEHILLSESKDLPRIDLETQSIFRGIRYSDEQKEYKSLAVTVDGAQKIMASFGIAGTPSGKGKDNCITDLSKICQQFIGSDNPSKVFDSATLVSNNAGSNKGVLIQCTPLWQQGVLNKKGQPLPQQSKRICCFWIKNLCIAAVISGQAAQVTKSDINSALEVEVSGDSILVYFSKNGRSGTWNL
tara:strand:+ start:1025 stop:1591 length:567 start_codon:yes stop_codon:yes gene_type:complete